MRPLGGGTFFLPWGRGGRGSTSLRALQPRGLITWVGAGPGIGNEAGDYVQPLGEGGLPPNFDSEFDRDFLPPEFGSEDGDFDNFEYFEDFGDDGGISDGVHDEEGIGDRNGVRFMYRDNIWNQDNFSYEPKCMEFRGDSIPNVFWYRFFTFLQLFELFWLHSLCRRIVHEVNQYAMERENEGATRGGAQ
jgi:hypothetical protein